MPSSFDFSATIEILNSLPEQLRGLDVKLAPISPFQIQYSHFNTKGEVYA
jgi:hypothetical protein